MSEPNEPPRREPTPTGTHSVPAAGDAETLVLAIGPLTARLELRGVTPELRAELSRRYAAFAVPAAPWLEPAFSLALELVAAPGRADRSAQPLSIQVDRRAAAGPAEGTGAAVKTIKAIKIDRWDFEVRLLRAGPGEGSSLRGHGQCAANPYAFDSLLRVLWSVLLPRQGGALLHACGIRQEGARAGGPALRGGLVFAGRSGAGKTTLARKTVDPDRVLSDEIVLVAPGADGAYRVFGTPFWGEFERGGTSSRGHRLIALCFLRKAERASAGPLSHGEAVLRLLECFLCFERDAETASHHLALATALCAATPALDVGSALDTPEPAVAAAVEAALPAVLATAARAPDPPEAPREAISELRALLGRHRLYPFAPLGGSMRPFVRPGDTVFIRAARPDEVRAGDLIVYWTPGRSAWEDRVICHRFLGRIGGPLATRYFTKGDALVSVDRFDEGASGLLLGKVHGITREGRALPAPGAVGRLLRLGLSLAFAPLYWLARRS